MSTRTQSLNKANPNEIADLFRLISIGDIMAGLIPRHRSRTGLASSATQVHDVPGAILQVIDAAGTTALAIVSGTAGAGEVQVTYDANGLATLVFGDGANTAYRVNQQVLPSGLGAILAATHTGAT